MYHDANAVRAGNSAPVQLPMVQAEPFRQDKPARLWNQLVLSLRVDFGQEYRIGSLVV